MDSQVIIATTQGIISAISKELTPAAHMAYQAAIIGSQAQALYNLTNDFGFITVIIVSFLCAISSIGGFIYTCRYYIKHDSEGAIIGMVICTIFFIISLVVFAEWLSDIGQIFFDYQMYQHPDAYLAYNIMNDIEGKVQLSQ